MGRSKAEKRWSIIIEWKKNPSASMRELGRLVEVHHTTAKLWIQTYQASGDVLDKDRSGRKALVTPAVMAEMEATAADRQQRAAISCPRLAKHVHERLGVCASARTIQRALRSACWGYQAGKRSVMLTPLHKRKRLAWAQHHLDSNTNFARWMFTDSKIFLLQKIGTRWGLKMWAPYGQRWHCPMSKSTLGVHVYLGITRYGLTFPIFVTGAQSQVSTYIDPKTGKPYVGVCGKEYEEQVLPKLKSKGDQLFAIAGRYSNTWVLQQDNAPAHVAKDTKAALQKLMPGRWEQSWPPMSPDLSCIENLWSWAERELQISCQAVNDVSDLKAAITHVFRRAPKEILENLVDSTQGRLHKVIQAGGGHIGR